MASNLATRAAAAVERQQDPKRATIKDQIKSMESQFALAMPRGHEAAQLVRDALTIISANPNLAKCSPASVLGSLMTCAQLGLRPNVLGQAYVLPRWSSKARGYEASFQIGYQGLIELAHRTGRIESLIAREVHENDHFDVDYGADDKLIHKPLLTGDRGRVIAYYAVAKYLPQGRDFLVASISDIEKHRDKFASARTKEGKIFGPWADHFDSMALKTVALMLLKWAPKSTEMASAISADEGVRLDYSPETDPATATEHDYVDAEPVEEVPDEAIDETGLVTEADIAAMNAEATS